MWEPKVFSASVLVQPKSDCALYNYGLKFDLFEKFSNTESCGIKLPVRRCSNSSRWTAEKKNTNYEENYLLWVERFDYLTWRVYFLLFLRNFFPQKIVTYTCAGRMNKELSVCLKST